MRELKLAVAGSGGVGKSALTVQFCQHVFVETYDPTIEDGWRVTRQVMGTQVIYDILDFAGTEQFTAMRDLYIKNGQAFMVVFSLSDRSSFGEVADHIDLICRIRDEDPTEGAPKMIVGNKLDLDDDRTVTDEEIEALANEFGIPFMLTSAKTPENVEEAFQQLTERFLEAFPDANNGRANGHRKKPCTIC